MVAVDAHDVAFGTSRWSSKLVHGGLRYLAKGQVDVAHESAVERGILMQTTAPHLVRALPMLMPLTPVGQPARRRWPRPDPAPATCCGWPRAPARDAPPAAPDRRHRDAHLAPVVRRTGCAARSSSWDGQLEDDARLVLAVARTAAAHTARGCTRASG